MRMIQSKLMNVSLREVDTDTTARSPNWLRRTFGWRTWAERPLAHSSAVGQSGTVQVAPDLLRRADRADTLPRLGGMARPNGVVIVSERHWAFARVDGELFEGEMPERRQRAARIPLVRGLLRLAASMTPLVRGQGVAGRRERSLLLLAVGAPLLFWLLPATVGLVAGIVVSVGLVAWVMRGRTLRLHGAEHRAIAAAEQRQLAATWAGTARPSRFSPRCGTNFAALALPVTYLLDTVWPFSPAPWAPAVVAVLSLALTMELWQVVQDPAGRILRPLLVPGLALQRVTTREPALADTRVALAAVESVLRRDLDRVDP